MSTRVIADEHEIRNLVHRYADAASRRDPAGVASAFTTDGEWHAPQLGHFKGHDEYIRDADSWLIARRRYDPLLRNVDGAVIAIPFPTDVPTIE
jgi:ketosteroid isomerase-like protein